MKLQDRLPDGVTVDGRYYRLDFDFRNVLNMLHELNRDDIMPEVRAWRAVRCLTKRPKNEEKVLAAVCVLLFDTPKRSGQKVTDFEQDAGLIRAAFRQAYGIDLYRDKLHWIEFTELLNALPNGSRFAEVVGIRARPMPAATKYNAEERAWLARAKADVALHIDDEEEREERYRQDIRAVGSALLTWAGSKHG